MFLYVIAMLLGAGVAFYILTSLCVDTLAERVIDTVRDDFQKRADYFRRDELTENDRQLLHKFKVESFKFTNTFRILTDEIEELKTKLNVKENK